MRIAFRSTNKFPNYMLTDLLTKPHGINSKYYNETKR
jgi:hypothetical protein